MSIGRIMGDLVKGKRAQDVDGVPSLVDIMEDVHREYRSTANYIRPHMIGGCFRASVFHLLGKEDVPNRISSKLRRIVDNGSAVHSVVQKYLSDSQNFFFAKEVPACGYVGDVFVKGTCDGVLIRRSDKYCLGIEIKTINHTEWSKLTCAKENHKQQALLYAYLLKIEWMKILYWDKDKQGLKEYGVRCTNEGINPIFQKVALISEARARGGMPPFRREECDPFFCKYYVHCPEVGGLE